MTDKAPRQLLSDYAVIVDMCNRMDALGLIDLTLYVGKYIVTFKRVEDLTMPRNRGIVSDNAVAKMTAREIVDLHNF